MFAVSSALMMTFGTPEHIEQALDKSNAYASLSNKLKDEATRQGTEGQDKSTQDLAESPEVTSAAKSAITPDVTKQASHQLIEGTYRWLDGTTKQPDFHIDLTSAVNTFLSKVGDNAADKASKLPVCTLAQLQQINAATISIDSLPCLPPGISVSTIRQQSIDKLVANNDFLKKPVLTADSLPKNSRGETAFDRADVVPTVFQVMKLLPMITGIAAVVLALLIWLLQRDIRATGRRLGRSLVISGVSLLIIGVATSLILSTLRKQATGTGQLSSVGGDSIGAVIQILVDDVTRMLVLFGAVYLVVGIIIRLIIHFVNPEKPEAEESAPANAPEPLTTRNESTVIVDDSDKPVGTDSSTPGPIEKQ